MSVDEQCAPHVPVRAHSQTPEANRVEILFIIDQLCTLGGAERVLLRMVDRLPRERFCPSVLTFKLNTALGIADSISCPLHVLPLTRTYDGRALIAANTIRRIVKRRTVRITHTFHETSDLWAAPIARVSGCPILISSRRDMGFNRGRKHRAAYRWMGKRFTQIQAVSEEVRQRNIAEDRLDPNRIVTIYNGVDLGPLEANVDKQPLRAKLGLGHAARLITFVGHIRSVKGVDILLQAAAQVLREMPDVVFVVAGGDDETEHALELKRITAALGLGRNFLFLGGGVDIPLLLNASDIFCLLSRTEGLSNALLEAMGCGLPCIATRVGGNPEIVIEGVTGFLVENEDAAAAAARILELLRDPVLCQAFGGAARKTVERRFTTEIMMTRLIDSYERLLEPIHSRKS